jgi:hypothetical protein
MSSNVSFDAPASLPPFLYHYFRGLADQCWQGMAPQPEQFDKDGNKTSDALPAKDVENSVCLLQPGGKLGKGGLLLKVEPRPVSVVLGLLHEALVQRDDNGNLVTTGRYRELLDATVEKLKLPLPRGHLRLLILISERSEAWVFALPPASAI